MRETIEYQLSDLQFTRWTQEIRELFFDGIAEMNVGPFVQQYHPYSDWTHHSQTGD
jgi:hypothetical protein